MLAYEKERNVEKKKKTKKLQNKNTTKHVWIPESFDLEKNFW